MALRRDDTIAALATAPGVGAIAVVRLSGPRARDIARAITGIEPRAAAGRALHVSRCRRCGARSRARAVLRGSALVHGRGRRRAALPRRPHRQRRVARRCVCARRAACRGRRVHAARVPQRQDRSAAGRGDRRSRRERLGAGGACGRALTRRRILGRRRRATAFPDDSARTNRGVARLSGRGAAVRRCARVRGGARRDHRPPRCAQRRAHAAGGRCATA